MILKRIQIKNIRSYENSEIIFPEGSILLSGDIGTGKTSILMSIEFGLFGLQPGQKGSSILRNGFDSGGVILEFEIDEKKIVVERTLKKSSKSITQDYCSIEIDGEKEELSVTELKSRILELLSYPSEFAKKQNMLYKFTVYTPQEEMKQIMLEDADMRINTLRHVFGIDKYKKVIENCSIVLAKIREEKRFKEGLIENLENDKSTLVKKETEIQEKEKETFILEKNVALKKIEVEKIKNEQQEINQKILEKNRIEQEIEKTKLMIATKKDLMESNKRVLEQLKNSLEELNSLDFDERKISELETEIKELRIKKEILTEEFLKASSQIKYLCSEKFGKPKSYFTNRKVRNVPPCLQDVNPVHKSNVLNKVEGDVAENAKKIKEFSILKTRSPKILHNCLQKYLKEKEKFRN
jgi:exonuclease SbcC